MGMNANDWIKDRRSIHGAATEGPWEADGFVDEYQGEDVIRLSIWSGPPSSEDSPVVVHSIRSHENTEFILDAHNTLPALLTAVEKVLELLDDPGGPDSWSHTFQGRHSVFADDVRAAIEGAIK